MKSPNLKELLASIESRFDEAIRPFSKDCDLFLVPNINASNKFWAIERKTEDIKAFIKQSHEEIIEAVVEECIQIVKSRLPDEMTKEEMDKYETEAALLYWGKALITVLSDLKSSLLPLVEKEKTLSLSKTSAASSRARS